MDRANQILAQSAPFGEPKSFRALADHGGVPHSTLHRVGSSGTPSEES